MVIASDEWLLEDAEFGVYWKLILRLNQAGGELPYDLPFLQKKLLVKRKNLQTLIEKLSKKPDFLRISGGKISLRKVEEVLAEQTEKHQKRVAAGQLGGLAKAAKSSNATVLLPSLPEQLELEQELELKNNTPLPPKGEGKAKAMPMPIPTVEEVRAYMAERGWADPDYMAAKVHAHYELNKWAMSTGKKLKSWKHAVDNTWDKNKYEKRPAPKTNGAYQQIPEVVKVSVRPAPAPPTVQAAPLPQRTA
jgi:hypothetical protein